MDFVSLFDVITCAVVGNTEEANQKLTEFMEEDKPGFIQALLGIILDESSPQKRRISAIKFLTVPIKSNHQTSNVSVPISGVDVELLASVTSVLIELFDCDDAFSNPAVDVYSYYLWAFPQELLFQQIDILFSRINEQTSAKLFTKLLTVIYQSIKCSCISSVTNIPQYFAVLVEYFSTRETEDLSKKILLKLVNNLIILCDPSSEGNEILVQLFAICWEYTLMFPNVGDKLWKTVIAFPYFLEAIPNIGDLLYEAISQSMEIWPLLSLGTTSVVIDGTNAHLLDGHESEVLSYTINLLAQQESFEDEKLVTTVLDALTFAIRVPEVKGEAIAFIQSKLGECQPKDKIQICIVLNSFINSGNSEDVAELFTDIIASLIQEEYPPCIICGLNFAGLLMSKKLIEPDAEMIQAIASFCSCENSDISTAAMSCVSFIGSCDNEEIREVAGQLLFEIASAYEDQEIVSNSLTALSNYVTKISPKTALEHLQITLELVGSIIEQHSEDITVSPAIGVLCKIFAKAGIESAPFSEAFINVAGSLLDDPLHELDGLTIIDTVINIFGSSSSEVLQYASELVMGRLSSADNLDHLMLLMSIATTITPFIESPECLSFILGNSLEFLTNKLFSLGGKEVVYDLIASINDKSNDLIIPNAQIIVENYNTLIDIKKYKNPESQARLALTCASAFETCEEIVSIKRWVLSIFKLLDQNPISENAGSLCIAAVQCIAAKFPSQLETIRVYPLNDRNYQKLEALLSPEEQEILHTIVPISN